MAKLWQGSGGGLHPLVEAYTVGEDYRLDGEFLLPYDLKASEAHATMLQKIGVLTAEELTTLKRALQEIGDLWRKGDFKVTLSQEDGHTAIEQYITEKYGEVGKKIHTGRSRNDQSMTMIRLYSLEQLKTVKALVLELSKAAEARGSELKAVPMPGYTHMQRAMPTTVGTWLGSFAAGWLDAQKLLEGAMAVLDQNPLGSAAGFGINGLQLDRGETAKLMGFAGVQHNPMYCGLSRGMFENVALQAMSLPMVLSSRFATERASEMGLTSSCRSHLQLLQCCMPSEDMMMFTQQESLFVALPDNFVTGSSIMPQKKNYDLFEIMRANGKVFGSLQMQIQETIVGLGSGYHRDLQCTKKAFIEACELCTSTLRLLKEVLPALQVREEKLRAAMTEDLYVTDEVYKLVAKGKAFREAYGEAKEAFFKRKAQVGQGMHQVALKRPRKANQANEANQLLEMSELQDTASFNKAISACRRNWQAAVSLLRHLAPTGLRPSAASFGAAASACEKAGCWQQAVQLALTGNIIVYNAVTSACAKKEWQRALMLLNQLPAKRTEVDVITYNCTLGVCDWQRSLHLLQDLEQQRLQRSVVSFSAAITACERGDQWQRALLLFGRLERDLTGNAVAYSAAIRACEKGKQWQQALVLLQRLGARSDAVAFNCALNALAQVALWQRALVLLERMGPLADLFSYSSAMTACDLREEWQVTVALLAELRRKSMQGNVVIYNAVISAFEKGGRWQEAVALLSQLERSKMETTVVSYGAAISACDKQTRWQQGLDLLERLARKRLAGNVVTFTAAISGCAKASQWQPALSLLENLEAQRSGGNFMTFEAAIHACDAGPRRVRGSAQWQLGGEQDAGDLGFAASLVELNASEPAKLLPTKPCHGWLRTLLLLRDLALSFPLGCMCGTAGGRSHQQEGSLTHSYVMGGFPLRGDGKPFLWRDGRCEAMRGPSWQEAVHALSHESEPSLAACTKAVAACRGQWQQALRCFGKATPDVALFGAAVAVCEWEVSWGLLAQLRRARLRRSSRVFGAALRGSRWLEALEGLRELAEVSLQKTFFCCNLATNACARGQQWPEAVALHEQTGSDLVSFGTAVSACERGSQWEAAAALAVSLREARLQGNIITYNTAISAFAKGQQWPGAQLLLAELQTRHLQGDSVTEETITGPWQQAAERIWSSALHWHRVLEQLRQAPCDAFTFSWSISRCGDRWPAALALLHEQGLRRLRRTVVALGAATSASAAGGWRLAPALLAAADFGPDLALCGAALKACAEHPRQTQRLLEDFKLDPDGAYSIAFASGHVTDWRWALIFLDQMEALCLH
ncbi:unnamed protein product [Effrenium voratum]|uniref:Fumarate lyase N-terminal domain-containing protein n=1 Tax=Effrenium voratum TaxID=2562239 RepID=A0AA36JTB7_9DINO|nr:unnamed protein product [Effrenium voratum]